MASKLADLNIDVRSVTPAFKRLEAAMVAFSKIVDAAGKSAEKLSSEIDLQIWPFAVEHWRKTTGRPLPGSMRTARLRKKRKDRVWAHYLGKP